MIERAGVALESTVGTSMRMINIQVKMRKSKKEHKQNFVDLKVKKRDANLGRRDAGLSIKKGENRQKMKERKKKRAEKHTTMNTKIQKNTMKQTS